MELESHWCAVNAVGSLRHTIRFPDGLWQPFEDVGSQAEYSGELANSACAVVETDLHVCAVSAAGRLWHTIRFLDGSWQRFEDMESQSGDMGEFTGVACAGVGAELHVCAVNAEGRLWHTIRYSNGSWQPFGDVEREIGDMGALTHVACAAVGSDLHICAVNAAGRLWHTIRHSNGSWQPFGDVEREVGDMGTLRDVACTGVGAELHVCAVNAAGRLWHTIRFCNGPWQPFGDVEGQSGDMGALIKVACAYGGTQVEVSAVNAAGRLWHTIRFLDGSWQLFGDIESQTGDIGDVKQVCTALPKPNGTNLKYFGYYWGMDPNTLPLVEGTMNVMFVSNEWSATTVDELLIRDTADLETLSRSGAKGIVDVSAVFFDLRNNYNLYSDWESRWNHYWSQMYARGNLPRIAAFYPLDEPDSWISPATLHSVAHLIRINVDSTPYKIPVMVALTASGVLRAADGSYPISEDIEWLGFDEYDCLGSECHGGVSIKDKLDKLRAIMGPRGSSVFVVGQGFSSNPTPNLQQEQALINRNSQYYQLASSCHDCTGMFVFRLSVLEDGGSAVASMPSLLSYLRTLGKRIVDSSINSRP